MVYTQSQNLLLEAFKIGDLHTVKQMVESGYGLFLDLKFGLNAFIIYAIEYRQLHIVKYLISFGRSKEYNQSKQFRDNDCFLTIYHASENGYLEIVKYLYSIGVDPTEYNNTAIHYASKKNHIEVVKYLALIGCDTNVIENLEHRKIAEDYVKYKKLFKNCLNEIYGNPRLERTRTENEISFREYQN